MGMFDNILWLDNDLEEKFGCNIRDFQTKSFDEPSLNWYVVKNGKLYISHSHRKWYDYAIPDREESMHEFWKRKFNDIVTAHLERIRETCTINFYGYENSKPNEWFDFEAEFFQGKLIAIRQLPPWD